MSEYIDACKECWGNGCEDCNYIGFQADATTEIMDQRDIYEPDNILPPGIEYPDQRCNCQARHWVYFDYDKSFGSHRWMCFQCNRVLLQDFGYLQAPSKNGFTLVRGMETKHAKQFRSCSRIKSKVQT